MKRYLQHAPDVLSHSETRCCHLPGVQPHERAKTTHSLMTDCLRSNSADGWRELVLRFRPVIAGAIGRVARHYGDYSSGIAEQLTQDTLAKLCERKYFRLRKPVIANDLSLYGYIRVVARNLAVDYFRKEQPWLTLYGGDPEIVETHPSRCRHSLPISEQRVLLAQVATCFKRVAAGPTARRDWVAFWLYYCRGLTATEIARRPWIKLTPKGVESLLNRMLIRLRHELVPKTCRSVAAARSAAIHQSC